MWPSFVVSMLDGSDPDAFNDRQFFVCPKEVEFMYDELRVPVDPSVPKLEDLFRIVKNAHRERVIMNSVQVLKQSLLKHMTISVVGNQP